MTRSIFLGGRGGGMSGRSWGRGGVGGKVRHVPAADTGSYGAALCGARPGRRSTGWLEDDREPTCAACLARLTRLEQLEAST